MILGWPLAGITVQPVTLVYTVDRLNNFAAGFAGLP